MARFCAANRHIVAGIYLLIAVLSGAYAAAMMTIDPDAGASITLDDSTAAAQRELERQFPGIEHTFLAIVESRDSAVAREQALALATSLTGRGDLFQSAFVPGTGAFYDNNALLFHEAADLRLRVDAVLQMQPLYQALAAAPDILGLTTLVTEIGKAVEQGRSPPGLEALLLAASNAIEGEVRGAPRPIQWPRLAGLEAETRSVRWFVVASPQPGQERPAAEMARQSSEGMQGVRWLWPRRALASTAHPLRDFLVPAGLSAFVTLTLLGAGLGSFRLTLAIVLPASLTLAVSSAVAASLGQPLDGATWSFAGAALAPVAVSSIILVLAHMQARAKGVTVSQAVMLAAHRRGGVISVLMLVFCAFWVSWLVRQLPSLSQFAVIAMTGAAVAWIASLTLLPAMLALLDRGPGAIEPHWLDDALSEPTSHHARNALDIIAMVVLAAAVFSAAFLPGVRFGERQIPSSPGLLLETPDARGAIHVLARPDEADAVVAALSKLPEIGAIRTIAQFMPPDAAAKIAELKRLESVLPTRPAQRPPAEEDVLRNSFAELERELTSIAASPSSSAGLRDAGNRLRRAVGLFVNPEPPTAGRVLALETALFSGLGEISRSAERLSKLAAPQIGDLDPQLLKRFVAADGTWRIEIMPKPETGSLSFAAALRRAMPAAAGEPLAALARNEIIHHETLLALAAAFVGVAVLALAALRNLAGWMLSLVPVSAFVTLTSAAVVTLDVALNSAMLAAASAVAAVLICSSVVIAEQLAAEPRGSRFDYSIAMRAGLLPPLVLAGAVAPLAISSRPAVAELGATLALMLLLATVLCVILIPPLARWFRQLAR